MEATYSVYRTFYSTQRCYLLFDTVAPSSSAETNNRLHVHRSVFPRADLALVHLWELPLSRNEPIYK